MARTRNFKLNWRRLRGPLLIKLSLIALIGIGGVFCQHMQEAALAQEQIEDVNANMVGTRDSVSLDLMPPDLASQAQATALLQVPNFWHVAAPPPAPQQVIRRLRFVTSDDFPPFNFLDATDTLIGFNVDIARAACDALNAQCTMAIRPFETISTALADGSADVAIAGLSPQAEAHADLLFSNAYFALPARFITKLDSDLDGFPEALAKQSIGVVEGSQHQAFLDVYFPASTPRVFATTQDMRQALAADEIPIIFDDAVTASYWLNSPLAKGCCRFASGPYLTPTYFGEGLMLATGPQNKNLLEALEYALYRVFVSGRYSEIYLRYFPISPF